jgi:hypothetical protein
MTDKHKETFFEITFDRPDDAARYFDWVYQNFDVGIEYCHGDLWPLNTKEKAVWANVTRERYEIECDAWLIGDRCWYKPVGEVYKSLFFA